MGYAWGVHLFSSVFKGCAKRFSAYLCLVRSNLDVTCGTMTVTLVIFAGDNVTGNSLDNVFRSAAAIFLIIHNIMLHSA